MERWGTSSARSSIRSSVSSGVWEITEEPAAAVASPVEEKLHVAVPAEFKAGSSNLVWALQNFSKDVVKIVITHVHVPNQMIPFMGTKFHFSKLEKKEVNAYRHQERGKMEKSLHEYLVACSRLKVRAEKLIIEADDIEKGLEELIVLHGITKLVMGAAADKHHSKKMKTPRSKTAIRLMEGADPSCKIYFVCKGMLICTREANSFTPTIPPSPARSFGSVRSLSDQMQAVNMSGSLDPWERILGRRSQRSGHLLGPMSDDTGSQHSGSVLFPKYEESEDGLVVLPSAHESDEELQFSSPRPEFEDAGTDVDVYDKLKEALDEAENAMKEAHEESNRRRKAEKDLFSALQKVKESESLYLKEVKQRREIEEALERKKQEMERLKSEQDGIDEQLRKADEQNLALEQQIGNLEHAAKELEDKLAVTRRLLESLQADHDQLQRERDGAVREAEGLRYKRQEPASASQDAFNSEFSFDELQAATKSFSDSFKIGEGGFGSVYKGFLRNTTVAVKMLHPQSMQGESEFHQEIAVLSKVRHPNLVTLIGACPEASCLVYEFLLNGSLEDRLQCRNSTPPLTWQVRTRIIGEICSALIFLHSHKPHPVVHGDLQPGNILLDANFVSKLGDFGISRLTIESSMTTTAAFHRTTQPKGTYAYMDPEYLSSGELTPRSDVYSFGIIILRLLTGKSALRIAEIVEDASEAGNLHLIIDASAGDWPFVQAKQLAHLGLICSEPSRRRRADLRREVWPVIEPMMKAASLSASPAPSGSILDDNHVPSYFICPIFQEIMRDPHIAADGFTYEAEAIKGWLDGEHNTSPMTNLKLAHTELTPNRALRSAILELLQQQPQLQQ